MKVEQRFGTGFHVSTKVSLLFFCLLIYEITLTPPPSHLGLVWGILLHFVQGLFL